MVPSQFHGSRLVKGVREIGPGIGGQIGVDSGTNGGGGVGKGCKIGRRNFLRCADPRMVAVRDAEQPLGATPEWGNTGRDREVAATKAASRKLAGGP